MKSSMLTSTPLQHRRRNRHLRRLAPPSRRTPLRLAHPRRRASRRHRRRARGPLHHHAHVRVRAEQRRDRSDALREPQSRLRRLLLAADHGHLRQIRRRSRGHPFCGARWHDNLPLRRCRVVGYPHHFHDAVYEAQ